MLGAGASKPDGLPLAAELRQRILHNLESLRSAPPPFEERKTDKMTGERWPSRDAGGFWPCRRETASLSVRIVYD